MSLSTITQGEFPAKKRLYNKPEMRSLKTSDIEGAGPKLKAYGFTNKPEFANSTEFISGSRPKVLHANLNKPQFNMMTEDIEKAQPSKPYFQTTRPPHNPLDPVYKLPSYESRPVTPPKFIRDSIQVNDIEGTKTESYLKWQQRDIISVQDIEGAKPKPEKYWVKPNFTDPSDINDKDTKQYLNRHREEIEKNKPKKWVPEYAPHARHLDTRDIEGARPNTVGLGPFLAVDRKGFIDKDNIEGAQAGSYKTGISTLRTTNPLNPQYKWVTEEEVKEEKPTEEVKVDEGFQKNSRAFWGFLPPPPPKKDITPALKIDDSFKRNSDKFFDMTPHSTPLEVNARNFYNNPEFRKGNAFQHIENPHSIHRPKMPYPTVDREGENFKNNTRAFFDETAKRSRPATAGKQFDQTAEKFYNSSASNYQFKLPRGKIGTPAPAAAHTPLESSNRRPRFL